MDIREIRHVPDVILHRVRQGETTKWDGNLKRVLLVAMRFHRLLSFRIPHPLHPPQTEGRPDIKGLWERRKGKEKGGIILEIRKRKPCSYNEVPLGHTSTAAPSTEGRPPPQEDSQLRPCASAATGVGALGPLGRQDPVLKGRGQHTPATVAFQPCVRVGPARGRSHGRLGHRVLPPSSCRASPSLDGS